MALEAKLSHSFGPSTWVNTEKLVKTSSGFLRVSEICKDKRNLQMYVSRQLPETNMSSPVSDVSCSHNNYSASAMKPGYFPISLDDSLILKNKCEEIGPYLYGRCIYLVGMMGSGKTTVGRILADVLGYSFLDCDVLVEQAVGGHSVAEIFKLYSEDFFRDTETEVLLKLSPMKKFVVSTGGGAVLRPVNWKHMRSGISILLDVPLEALAQRITSVGTNSRPLLHEATEDGHPRIFRRLTAIMEKRAQAYTNANARVSLDFIAAKHGYTDNLSPAAIAIEALDQIESFVKDDCFAI